MNKKEIKKTLPPHYIRHTGFDKLTILSKAVIGMICQKTGRPVPWLITPDLAASSWFDFLKKSHLPAAKEHIAILAIYGHAWMQWALYAACWARRLGFAPILLYSQRDINTMYGACGKRTLKQRILFGRMWESFQKIPGIIPINLDMEPEPDADVKELFKNDASEVVHSITAYDLYVEEHEQGPLKSDYDRRVKIRTVELIDETARAYKLLRRLVDQYAFRRLIGFNGIIGKSSCYEAAARELGLTRVWVETWGILPGLMRWSVDKPALHFDIKEWMEILEWTEEDQLSMKRYTSFQETGKVSSEDGDKMKGHLNYQIVGKDSEWPDNLKAFIRKDNRPVFLLAANVVGDSASFQRQTIFESQRTWINEVVGYFSKHTDKKLIIRAHPGERAYALDGNLNVDIGKLAAEKAEGLENVYVIGWQDPVNTYSLVPHICAGLTWVSNTGVDLVLRGIPVISAARPAYEGLGITLEPKTKEHYFELIDKYLTALPAPDDKQTEASKKYLCVIYKKIGAGAFGAKFDAVGLRLDHPLSSDFGRFYRTIFGVKDPVACDPGRIILNKNHA